MAYFTAEAMYRTNLSGVEKTTPALIGVPQMLLTQTTMSPGRTNTCGICYTPISITSARFSRLVGSEFHHYVAVG